MEEQQELKSENTGEEKTDESQSPQPIAAEPTINKEKWDDFLQRKKMEQSLHMGFVACLVTAFVGAILWAVISISTEHQIGYMAIGVGFLVGFGNRYLGKGIDKVFGYMGAVFALLGCIFGNIFTLIGFVAQGQGLSFTDVIFNINWAVIPGALAESFSPIDLLFYGIAAYEGYKFSFRRIEEEELKELASP